MRAHAATQTDNIMAPIAHKHGGSGTHRHAKGAVGVQWAGETVGGMNREHAHLQCPARCGACGSNLQGLVSSRSSPKNLRTHSRHVKDGGMYE